VVQLVEDDECVAGETGEQRRARRDLLVRGDDAVHVRRQCAVRGRPRVVEMERERRGRAGPLHLQVRRRRNDDQPSGPLGELVPRGGQGEGRLARARRRNREEVGLRRLDELVEGGLLPAS
jgi:hypothetical protein